MRRVSDERALYDDPIQTYALSGSGNQSTVARLDGRLDVAYDQVAETEVDLAAAERELARAKQEYQTQAIAYLQSLQPKSSHDGQR